MNFLVLAVLLFGVSSVHMRTAAAEDLEYVFCEKFDSPNPACVDWKNFKEKVLDSPDLVVIQPTARWCTYCRRLKAEVPLALSHEKLQGKSVRFYWMNYDLNVDFMKKIFKIDSLPSLYFFSQGEALWWIKGGPTLLQMVRDFGYAYDAVQADPVKIEKYPTLLEEMTPLRAEIEKFYSDLEKQLQN